MSYVSHFDHCWHSLSSQLFSSPRGGRVSSAAGPRGALHLSSDTLKKNLYDAVFLQPIRVISSPGCSAAASQRCWSAPPAERRPLSREPTAKYWKRRPRGCRCRSVLCEFSRYKTETSNAAGNVSLYSTQATVGELSLPAKEINYLTLATVSCVKCPELHRKSSKTLFKIQMWRRYFVYSKWPPGRKGAQCELSFLWEVVLVDDWENIFL